MFSNINVDINSYNVGIFYNVIKHEFYLSLKNIKGENKNERD